MIWLNACALVADIVFDLKILLMYDNGSNVTNGLELTLAFSNKTHLKHPHFNESNLDTFAIVIYILSQNTAISK